MIFGKIIGVGNTATVYEWEEGKVLKLFNQGYPNEAVENEFHNAMSIKEITTKAMLKYPLNMYRPWETLFKKIFASPYIKQRG